MVIVHLVKYIFICQNIFEFCLFSKYIFVHFESVKWVSSNYSLGRGRGTDPAHHPRKSSGRHWAQFGRCGLLPKSYHSVCISDTLARHSASPSPSSQIDRRPCLQNWALHFLELSNPKTQCVESCAFSICWAVVRSERDIPWNNTLQLCIAGENEYWKVNCPLRPFNPLWLVL